MNKKWLQFFACTKLSIACKFAYAIRELHATPIMLAIYRCENFIGYYPRSMYSSRPSQPYNFQAEIRRYWYLEALIHGNI
jgi:hypothetical protein